MCEGGSIATNDREYFDRMRVLLPVYEGFFTYGGMSIEEVGAMAVGIREIVDEPLVGSEIELIRILVEELDRRGIPVVTPPGGLGAHLDAMEFLSHVPQKYPAGALAAALYLVSGIRAMERGTMSMERDELGREVFSDLELVRIAFPRRVYLRSHVDYAVDRIAWLFEHRDLIKGLRWVYEPPVLRFFLGRLKISATGGRASVRPTERNSVNIEFDTRFNTEISKLTQSLYSWELGKKAS